jgi:hypothetical protein
MVDEKKRADNDSPWKEILEIYFPQAIQFFFPEIAALIDWEHPHLFLDKEFQSIAVAIGDQISIVLSLLVLNIILNLVQSRF